MTLIDNDLLQIENKNTRFSIKWSGVMSGQMVGVQKENKVCEVFSVSLTLFLFDPINEKRLYLESGESLLQFVFKRHSDGYGKWVSLGWLKDEYDEWESLNSWH